MLTKSFSAAVKAAGPADGLGEGEYRALVSVFGNVDSFGDKVMPGAFTDTLTQWQASGDPIPVYYSHRLDDPEYNIGEVVQAKETDQGLEVHAKLDLENPKALQVYKLMKGRRLTQHSFTYDVEDGGPSSDGSYNELRKLRLWEVGPTPIGANSATQLLAVKSALPASSGPTSTSDGTWDGPAAAANLPNDGGAAVFRKAFAWVDPNGDPDTKAAYKFIHHEVSADGTVGAANLTACSVGIAELNGGRGGANIPDGDRAGVHAHLSKHIEDAGKQPPPLKSVDELSKTDPDTADEVADADTTDRADQATEPAGDIEYKARTKAGRTLSSKNEQKLRDAVTAIQDVLASLGDTADTGKADETQATTSRPANDEGTRGVKSEEPSGCSPAGVRLFTELDLLGLD